MKPSPIRLETCDLYCNHHIEMGNAGKRRIIAYLGYCSAVESSAVSVEMVDAHVLFAIY